MRGGDAYPISPSTNSSLKSVDLMVDDDFFTAGDGDVLSNAALSGELRTLDLAQSIEERFATKCLIQEIVLES